MVVNLVRLYVEAFNRARTKSAMQVVFKCTNASDRCLYNNTEYWLYSNTDIDCI